MNLTGKPRHLFVLTPIWRKLRDYVRADFRPDLYGATTAWVGLLLAVNYALDLENGYIDTYRGKAVWPVLYFALYATAYYVAVWLWSHFHRQTNLWRSRDFWLRSLTALVCYSIYAGFYAYNDWSRALFGGRVYEFLYYCLHNLQSALTIVLPLYVFYRLVDQRHHPSQFYGMAPKQSGLGLYALLLAGMVPLIAWASAQPDFLRAYPTYHNTNANEFFGVPEWVTVLVYELCYGWDFVPTELLFRGFLCIGMAHVLRGPALPMVVWYCTIHFGRPPAEAISSVLGGYLLGVMALSTRSIWGGLLIHIGIAWGMELAAFGQKWSR